MTVETTERPTTKAKVRHVRMSASKVRVVLNLIRNKPIHEALQILELTQRLAAKPIAKCLKSAIANAEHNDGIAPEELYLSACFADEGATLKRFRPVGRGRASKILKQTCHITVEVSRLSEEELDTIRTATASSGTKKASASESRKKRVAKSKKADEKKDAESVTEEKASAETDEPDVNTDEETE